MHVTHPTIAGWNPQTTRFLSGDLEGGTGAISLGNGTSRLGTLKFKRVTWGGLLESNRPRYHPHHGTPFGGVAMNQLLAGWGLPTQIDPGTPGF